VGCGRLEVSEAVTHEGEELAGELGLGAEERGGGGGAERATGALALATRAWTALAVGTGGREGPGAGGRALVGGSDWLFAGCAERAGWRLGGRAVGVLRGWAARAGSLLSGGLDGMPAARAGELLGAGRLTGALAGRAD
jgi:hypothetical protein